MAAARSRGRAVKKGDVVGVGELDEGVYWAQHEALRRGMIPIAGVMSREVAKGRHEVLGVGWNHLAEGVPGVHGETGAVMDMGRIEGGYGDVVATSSLTPCEFCQFTLACQMGVGRVRVLGKAGFSASDAGYAKAGITPERGRVHVGINATFDRWVKQAGNATLWKRDVGIYEEWTARPYDGSRAGRSFRDLLGLAHLKAAEGVAAGEGPIGAVIVDPGGEVIGAGHARIVLNNDPSCTAAMAAWRACGGRDQWKDKTLVLTAGADYVAYAMFHVFNFGQLIVGSDRVFAGETGAVGKIPKRAVPVEVAGDRRSDAMLARWIERTPVERVREYLGADFNA